MLKDFEDHLKWVSEHVAQWPEWKQNVLGKHMMQITVQVNGKTRDKITVSPNATDDTILDAAENAKNVQLFLKGKTVIKKLYVPNKLVNFVVENSVQCPDCMCDLRVETDTDSPSGYRLIHLRHN